MKSDEVVPRSSALSPDVVQVHRSCRQPAVESFAASKGDGECVPVSRGPGPPESVDRHSIEFPDVEAMREKRLLHRVPREVEVPYAKVADPLCVETGNVVREELESRVKDGAEIEVPAGDIVERAPGDVKRDPSNETFSMTFSSVP